MPQRVLITGATGFVGSHIAQAFAEAGYEVRCGVRASSDPRWLSGLAAQSVKLDLTDPSEDIVWALEGVDLVVHAAGTTRARRAEDYHAVNVRGTSRLAAAALESAVRRFVLISSLAARGPDGHDSPASHYGWSKLRAETRLLSLGGPMETVVLRPAAVYGPRDTDLLPLFRLASGGWIPVPSRAGLLQPVYAADVARAALAAAREPALGPGPLPVAESGRYTWKEVVCGLERALGRDVRAVRLPPAAYTLAGRAAEWGAGVLSAAPPFDERRARDLAVHAWTCDTSQTERALGWRAEVQLSEGLERTARWYRRVGWLSMKPR